MYVVSAAQDAPTPETTPEGLNYGVPCVFKRCSGFYHPAGGTIGVVLCSPWGFEDLSMRKSWRLLAESIALAGFPCIRFDYPGTGDSLGDSLERTALADWIGASATQPRCCASTAACAASSSSASRSAPPSRSPPRAPAATSSGSSSSPPPSRAAPTCASSTATATMVVGPHRYSAPTERGGGRASAVLGFALSRRHGGRDQGASTSPRSRTRRSVRRRRRLRPGRPQGRGRGGRAHRAGSAPPCTSKRCRPTI